MEFLPALRRHPLASLASLALVLALALTLVLGLRARTMAGTAPALATIDLAPDRPPPPERKPPPRPRPDRKPAGGAPAAARAAPPPPQIVLALPTLPTIPQPATGEALSGTTGAGSGGAGNGTGSGSGDGGGNGGDPGPATPAEQIAGRLTPRDLPGSIAPGGQLSVTVAYTVGVDGRVRDCTTPRSSGDAATDARVCELIEKRFRYRPARAADGHPVPSPVRETHAWARKPED